MIPAHSMGLNKFLNNLSRLFDERPRMTTVILRRHVIVHRGAWRQTGHTDGFAFCGEQKDSNLGAKIGPTLEICFEIKATNEL